MASQERRSSNARRNNNARGNSDGRIDGDADPRLDPYYQFLTDARPSPVTRTDHGVGGLTLSLMAHAALLLLVALVVGRTPASSPPDARPAVSLPLVWTPLAGGGRHPGGGGEPAREAARPAQLVGREAIAVPVAAPPRLDSPKPAEVPDPMPRLDIPALRVESGLQEIVGVVAELRPMELLTRGPGAGPGADGGRGPGIGGGDGRRLGDGDRAGAGDGDGLTPGNGVTWPRLVQEVKPNYTPDAMRAQVEGMVELEILVLADGSVGRVNIVRSLDARFGLDEEAVNAVRRWRFDPGRRLGKAVATRVGVELSFNLR
jgi:periplasmic protein TonB